MDNGDTTADVCSAKMKSTCAEKTRNGICFMKTMMKIAMVLIVLLGGVAPAVAQVNHGHDSPSARNQILV